MEVLKLSQFFCKNFLQKEIFNARLLVFFRESKMKQQHFKSIIIGGGASGLMCAAHIAEASSVLILEKQPQTASKVKISGGGNCNFTNLGAVSGNYLCSNKHFVKSALARFTPQDIIKILQQHHLKFEKRQNQQMFAFSAADVAEMLLKRCLEKRVKIQTNCQISGIVKQDGAFVITTNFGNFTSDNLIVATGGVSYPKIGATDLGYRIAKQFGHKIIPARPALVGLVAQPELRNFCSDLAGVSVPVIINIDKQKICRDLLFTHMGISGPAVLNASLYWQSGKTFYIDFLNGQTLSSLLENQAKKSISQIVGKVLPINLAKKLVGNLDCQIENLSNKNKQILNDRLTRFAFIPQKTMGFDRAEVTAGGVDVSQISSQTMESKLCPHLFFIGEVLDVTGELGGFNLQWAWASANAVKIY